MRLKTCVLLVAFAACVWATGALAQQELRLVTVTRTPFSFPHNGEETGFTLDLWRAVASELRRPYRIDRVETFRDMLSAVEDASADIGAANISITASREEVMDFSQPIFSSGLRVMVPAGQSTAPVLGALWSRDLGLAILAAIALLFGGGMLMWAFERNAQDYFRGKAREKLFPSFWWALNLVVNGGFEERMPRTIFGRIFATLLVVSSLFIVSLFVANITAALTVNAIQSSVTSVNDLYGKVVGTTEGSTSAVFLDGRDIRHQDFADLDSLLHAFEAHELDAVVFDAPILSYYANTTGAGVGELVGPVFLRENYGFALPPGSALREPINRALLRLRENGTYDRIYRDWFGTDETR